MAKDPSPSPSPSPSTLGLREAARLIARGRLSPIELLDSVLARIEAVEPSLNAFITITADSARAAAAAATRTLGRRRARLGPLFGVPVSLKDLILTVDAPTTCGSKIFGPGLPPDRDAPVASRLRRSGAILIGKNNLHEIALGVTTVNEHFGAARNPWDVTRVAGGSSGGSAVAVAAGMGAGSVGSDTRGSIRIPAACCGITGLKPTYGAVSTEGVLPLAPTLDHLGPMTRSAEDAALLFAGMVGGRSGDRALRAVDRKPGRVRVGVSEFFLRDADPDVARAVESAIGELKRLGCRIESVTVPELEWSPDASRVIVLSEAIAFHDPLLKRDPDGYGALVRSRLEGGYRLSALEYVQAESRRVELLAAYAELFRKIDCLVGATLPVGAPAVGAQTVHLSGQDVYIAEALCRYTAPQNLTGAPVLSVPCGLTSGGLPIGLQLIAGHDREDVVLGLGAAYQRATDWHERRPPLP